MLDISASHTQSTFAIASRPLALAVSLLLIAGCVLWALKSRIPEDYPGWVVVSSTTQSATMMASTQHLQWSGQAVMHQGG